MAKAIDRVPGDTGRGQQHAPPDVVFCLALGEFTITTNDPASTPASPTGRIFVENTSNGRVEHWWSDGAQGLVELNDVHIQLAAQQREIEVFEEDMEPGWVRVRHHLTMDPPASIRDRLRLRRPRAGGRPPQNAPRRRP